MRVSRKPFALRCLASALSVGIFASAGLSGAYAQTPANVVLPPVPPGAKAPVVAPAASVNNVSPAIPTIPAPPGAQKPVAPKPGAATLTTTPAIPGSRNTPTSSAPKAEASRDVLDAFSGLQMTPVSDSQLNRFIFPEPLEGVYFSEGAPLPECPEGAGAQDPCKPVFLNGKRMMLLQLRAGAKGPVQMLAHLQSGRVLTMNLAPGAGPGAVVRVEGAEDGASDSRLLAAQRDGSGKRVEDLTASEKNVALLARIARGELPGGFEAEAVGPAVRFEFFDVIPQAAWGNGSGVRAHLFQVRAHDARPVAINAGLFRTENVKAIALDRETITKDQPALLYVLEHLPEFE